MNSAHLMARIRISKSSFYWAIRLLPEPKRSGVAALYLFCRLVDDIADGPLPEAEKRRLLAAWRATPAAPDHCPDHEAGQWIRWMMDRFEVDAAPLEAVVDGVAMDLAPGLVAPDMETLRLYCSRVAGAVGLALVRILGARGPDADAFAHATGEALQFTNILRDAVEDAALDRLYLPRDLLEAEGVPAAPRAAVMHPDFPRVCARLAALADARYDEALARARALPRPTRRALRPALVMLGVYRVLFRKMQARGWERPGASPRLPKGRMFLTVLRYRFFDT